MRHLFGAFLPHCNAKREPLDSGALTMLTVYKYLLYLALMSCLLAYGCSTAKDLGKTLGDLAMIRAELIKKFSEADVNLRVNTFQNRTSISVIYVNSPLNQKTTEERARRAQETAEIVRQLYPSIKNISEIWVGFMRVTTPANPTYV